MSLRLVRVFGQAVIVGAPTLGKRRFGVPPGGAFDRESADLALALLNLPAETKVWEVAGSAEFAMEAAGTVALVGAPVSVALDGISRPVNAAWPFAAGQRLHLGATRLGARVYLAWTPRVLDERRLAGPPSSLEKRAIRLVRGPDDAALPLEGWTVAPASDRLGLRLTGPGVPHGIELPSRPTAPGTIQVTPSGMPILLGPDGPTIGGYPQAAVVIERDQSALAQLCLGEIVRFEWVDLDTARGLQAAHRAQLSRLGANLRLRG